MSQRERRDYTINLYWFTPYQSYIQSPEKPLGIPLRINQQITITQHNKEMILTPQEHTPSLPFHTIAVRTYSDLIDSMFYKNTK